MLVGKATKIASISETNYFHILNIKLFVLKNMSFFRTNTLPVVLEGGKTENFGRVFRKLVNGGMYRQRLFPFIRCPFDAKSDNPGCISLAIGLTCANRNVHEYRFALRL